MLIGSQVQDLLISSYDIVRRSGVLRTSIGARLLRSAYFFYKRYEDHLRELLDTEPWLVAGGHVLDIGANIGYTAAVFARAVGPGYCVHAFEPEPLNYRMLQQVAASAEFNGKIITYQCAVGAQEGSVRLWLNSRHPADHRVITEEFSRRNNSNLPEITVPMTTVDAFVPGIAGPISFIKVDVQGFEPEVCKGMLSTLDRHPSINLVLEYSQSAMLELGFQPLDLLNCLSSRGFTAYSIKAGGKLIPGLPDNLQENAYVDLLFTRNPELARRSR